MPVHNADIAAIFDEIADLLEIEGDNPFRLRAYRNAARTLRDLGREVSSMLEQGEDLTALPGIGADLAAKIQEIVETGTTPLRGKLRKKIPPALTELLHLPGLGPKRVKTLYHELDIHTVEQLHRAALDGRIRTLPGFGEKTEQQILRAIQARVDMGKRCKLAVAAQYADALVAYLKQAPGVKHVVVAGSYRRAKKTVGDLDILVTARSKSPVIERFVAYSEVVEVTAKGGTRASVRLASGLQVDLRVVPEESYGAALHYFTGSKAHNIAIRELGQHRGLKIDEYGVFKGNMYLR
jgi:DNA polymerase (family 10)